jgi:general secretion pathway protein H
MAVVGLTIAIALPYLAHRTSGSRIHILLANTSSLLRDARSAAIARHADVSVLFDGQRRLIWTDQLSVPIPPDVAVSVTTGGGCGANVDGTMSHVVFHADGTNCGSVFRFAANGAVYRLRVNWATGYVEALDG